MKNIYFCCRTSHEVRGLKYKTHNSSRLCKVSHLTRGAWIEIMLMSFAKSLAMSHLTRGAWIEILRQPFFFSFPSRRTSHEVRGLKF